ncbi:hypothetical protein QYM41_13670 [Kocuria sp. CPCC 205268]|uniref:hypothetical protein n=1 Tax=Kocuria oxytropis TaxID=3058913 RepID=UPI0034D5E169
MARLREAQKQMTRWLLLDKGLELFGTKGSAATTIDDMQQGLEDAGRVDPSSPAG